MEQSKGLAAETERVIAAATKLSGNADLAHEWFHTHAIDVFRGKTAEQLLLDGRVDDVLAYIEMLDAGPAG